MLHRTVSDDLEIRLLSLAQAGELYQLIDSNRSFLREWLPWLDSVQSVKDTETFIEAQLTKYKSNEALCLSIIYEGEIVGVAGLNEIFKEEAFATVGYWLAEDFNGKGIMLAVVKELMDIARDEYGLAKLEIWCASEKHRSRAIPEKLGFIHTGRYENAENLYGHWIDNEIYVLGLT